MGVVLLAGGGTVGHLSPGFAIRDALVALAHEARFVTPGEVREATWFAPGEPPRIHVTAPRMPRGIFAKVAFPFRMGLAIARARRMLMRERPDVVLALGGWPCAPTAIAAILKKIPLALVAADVVPGVVVRKLERRAAVTYLASEAALGSLAFPDKAKVVGPFVRASVLAARRDLARFGLVTGRATLLVVGGSLGAKGLNAVARTGLEAAVASDPSLAARLQLIHLTGTDEEAALAEGVYRRLGVGACVRPFVREMGEALHTADLVLCRGGASTLAEVAALARPAVVVPYPHHADRQQWKNAAPLVERGAVALIEEGALTPAAFGSEVLARLFDDATLRRMTDAFGRAGAGKVSTFARDGAATIALDLVRFFGTAGSRA